MSHFSPTILCLSSSELTQFIKHVSSLIGWHVGDTIWEFFYKKVSEQKTRCFNIYEIRLAKFLELLCPLVHLAYNIAILNLKWHNLYLLGSSDTNTKLFAPKPIYRTDRDSHRNESDVYYFKKKMIQYHIKVVLLMCTLQLWESNWHFVVDNEEHSSHYSDF